MWGDEREAVAPIIWLYQAVDAQKEEVFFPDFLIALRRYGNTPSEVGQMDRRTRWNQYTHL